MKANSNKADSAEPIGPKSDGPKSDVPESNAPESEPHLRRAIGLPLLVRYGLGFTIGAGIYVLIGTAAAMAGA